MVGRTYLADADISPLGSWSGPRGLEPPPQLEWWHPSLLTALLSQGQLCGTPPPNVARRGWHSPLVLGVREQGVRWPEPWGAPLGPQLDGEVLEAPGHGCHHDGGGLLPLTLLLDAHLGWEVVTMVLK